MVAGRTILAVDDDRALLDFYVLLLGGEGYRVVTAATLDEMQAALNEPPPDLVITDLALGGSPPWSVVDRIEADPVLQRIPVVVCTGGVQELEAQEGRFGRAGIRALRKPFDVEDLLGCVQELLGNEAAGRQSPQEGTLFDSAWEQWRQDLTAALVQAVPTIGARTLDALGQVGAYDGADGLIARDWALALLTRDPASLARLSGAGLDAAAIDRLVALIEQHPTPAAGG